MQTSRKVSAIVISLIILGAGCSSTSPSPKPHQGVDLSAEYGQNVTLQVDDTATYNDGLKVHLKAINDSRCPPDVACIWAGELSATLDVIENQGDDGAAQEVVLGTLSQPSATIFGYDVKLAEITETNATITVSRHVDE